MPETEKETTTIMVYKSTSELLNGLKRGREKYDDVILRLYNREVDVDTKIICIDNDLPQLHTLVLQLGDDPEILYFFNGTDFSPINPAEANKLMKQPKPNLTISLTDAYALKSIFDSLAVGNKVNFTSEINSIQHKLLIFIIEAPKK